MMFAKARQALHTSTPTSIVCRENELEAIKSFLQSSLEDNKSGSMYICGRPGTGKTACVNYLLSSGTLSGNFKSIFVNCMLLTSQNAIYHQIAKGLDSKSNLKGKEALAFIEEVLTDPGPMIILVLDEIDHIVTRDQSVLYTIFELPALTDSRLILIGIANALDFTDRSLVRLQSRVNCKPTLLNFPPYSKQEITNILTHRIKEAVEGEVSSVIAPSALQYLGSKISTSSGDMRKAIDACRRAVELAEGVTSSPAAVKKRSALKSIDTNSPTKSEQQPAPVLQQKCPVNIPLLCKMMAKIDSNSFSASNVDDESDETPLQQKLVVVSLLVLVKHGKSKEVTLGKLHQSYTKMCKHFKFTPLDFEEFSHTCSLVESRGVVSLKKKTNLRLAPISLRLDEKEVESTMKDKTLLSSILAQGPQFV